MDISGYDIEETAEPNITSNINHQIGQSNASTAAGYSGGMSQARGLLTAPDSFNQASASGDSAMSAAIRSRSNQQYGLQENQLKVSIAKNADADHLRNLQVATAAAGQEVEMNRQKQILKFKMDQANKKARGQILGTTLGIVGGIVGGVAGGMSTGGAGAASGAMAGYGIGSGVGQAAGENN